MPAATAAGRSSLVRIGRRSRPKRRSIVLVGAGTTAADARKALRAPSSLRSLRRGRLPGGLAPFLRAPRRLPLPDRLAVRLGIAAGDGLPGRLLPPFRPLGCHSLPRALAP